MWGQVLHGVAVCLLRPFQFHVSCKISDVRKPDGRQEIWNSTFKSPGLSDPCLVVDVDFVHWRHCAVGYHHIISVHGVVVCIKGGYKADKLFSLGGGLFIVRRKAL